MKSLVKFSFGFFIYVCALMPSLAQSQEDVFENYASPEFVQSVFYKSCESKTYPSTATWDIHLNYCDRLYDYSVRKSTPAVFRVIKEKEVVYDCSTKYYEVKSSNFTMIYKVRTYADCIELIFKGKRFSLNAIDGGEDGHIKNLKHEYKVQDGTETFALSLVEDLPLYTKYRKECLTLKKGSRLIITTSL